MTRGLEEEIPGVPDPPVHTKKSLDQILKQIPDVSRKYKNIPVKDRASVHHLPRPNICPLEIFKLFLTDDLLNEFAANTNQNARLHEVDPTVWEESSDDHSPPSTQVGAYYWGRDWQILWHNVRDGTRPCTRYTSLLENGRRISSLPSYY